MSKFHDYTTFVFDPLHAMWEAPRTQRFIAGVLVAVFLAALVGIELGRRNLLPPGLEAVTPRSHFAAIKLAFTLVLALEVVGLVFAIPCSVSKSVGKQFEILSLILLRGSFKELTHFPEPIHLESVDKILPIASSGLGALAIFALLGVYYRLNSHYAVKRPGEVLYRFVATKKFLALCLLALFVAVAVHDGWRMVTGRETYGFFAAFYTVLIFVDILVVLISQRYLPVYHAVFRNSGFALTTLLIRLALTAPVYYDALIGVCAAGFAVLLTLVFGALSPDFSNGYVDRQ